ncbi:MAG TPA: DUF2142 domain-containing protein, partial [Candidatus Acidoferrales bacterium]|nr:DUF2142 domain-containing protein [Candidatus Acidoferrales bacterium]
MDAPPAVKKSERTAVVLWCLLGAIHVFVFSAAFPFFSVVDEQVHFDLAVRYSRGEVPRALTPPSDEALPFIAIYGTPEYLWPPATQPGGTNLPPPWKQPLPSVRARLLATEAAYRAKFQNHEAASPPLYYALAGAWWRLGRLLKLDGGQLLYWLRFLNVPLVAALVWLGWRAARDIFPENAFIQLAVPALIAFLPQTTLYAINNDVLAPLTFGAAFLLVIKCWAAESLSPRLAAATGLALAATFLTKTSNLPLLAAAGVLLAAKILALRRSDDLRESLGPLLILALTAALPMAAWMAWCRMNFGDFTGAHLKIQFLGWTYKPFTSWFHHPLFSASGFWFFLRRNLATFWQGEMLWHRQPLGLPGVDLTYVVLSLGALAVTLAAWVSRPSPFTTSQRPALGLAFLCVLASFAFFALLSV